MSAPPTDGPVLWTQLENLRAAAALIQRAVPGAGNFELQTSDQNRYGFTLRNVIVRGGGSLEDADPKLLEQLADQVWQYVCGLDWNGVVGEDEGGFASLPVIAHLLPVEAARTFIHVNLGPQIHGTGLTRADLDRALLRVRGRLQKRPNVLVISKDRESFRMELLGLRGNLLTIASGIRVEVAAALRELAPHTQLVVHVSRTAPGVSRHGYHRALASAREVPVSVSVG